MRLRARPRDLPVLEGTLPSMIKRGVNTGGNFNGGNTGGNFNGGNTGGN
jgi:hypothetical protein